MVINLEEIDCGVESGIYLFLKIEGFFLIWCGIVRWVYRGIDLSMVYVFVELELKVKF